jgi:hypothetical protein
MFVGAHQNPLATVQAGVASVARVVWRQVLRAGDRAHLLTLSRS